MMDVDSMDPIRTELAKEGPGHFSKAEVRALLGERDRLAAHLGESNARRRALLAHLQNLRDAFIRSDNELALLRAELGENQRLRDRTAQLEAQLADADAYFAEADNA